LSAQWYFSDKICFFGFFWGGGFRYLTTGGQNFEQDKKMIEDAGFEIGHLVNA
jgi:biotin synthase-like enzyme